MKRNLLLLGTLWSLIASAQTLDSRHIMVDAGAKGNTPYTYTTFQEACNHLVDGVTIYIQPGVYWIDDPDDATIKVGENGREPFGLVVRCPHLRLEGLGKEAQDVVLASQRGQTQGAVGNFTMFNFWCDKLEVENLTMGNYCNVDLVYPKNPRWNRAKRSDAITQAHVGYMHGDSLIAKRVRFISRLNLNPLTGAAHSYYEDCHFECTDDALNGNATYRHCDFDFYGTKPFWSTYGKGALLIDCDFYAKSSFLGEKNVQNKQAETYFCKQGGALTLIDCRYHAPIDDIYIGWTAYPQPWLRCYQKDFTLNGKPYTIGYRQPQNSLSPACLSANLNEPPHLSINKHEATLQATRDTLLLKVSEPTSSLSDVKWRTEQGYERYATLRSNGSSVTVTPVNNTDETVSFCIVAETNDGREAACQVHINPSQLPPPEFTETPELIQQGGILTLKYELDLQGRRDESDIIWSRDAIPVSVSHDYPQRTYTLSQADQGHTLSVKIRPKHQRSDYGNTFKALLDVGGVTTVGKGKKATLSTDFHDFPCQWQSQVLPGYWTVDGYKPADTKEYPWTFDNNKPMWAYKEGFNGAVGKGLLQEQRGARLMYTPIENEYGDMHLTLKVDPTKTAGQGFGSATGQYMDVCLKFDTNTLTGYGLRIIRTTKHSKAVDFLLVSYDHGQITPLTEAVTATCYRTGCTISLDFIGNTLTAHVETTTPQPADSTLPHSADLSATVNPNVFGGIHIQHTGSSGGESTTMLHQLKASWQ